MIKKIGSIQMYDHKVFEIENGVNEHMYKFLLIVRKKVKDMLKQMIQMYKQKLMIIIIIQLNLRMQTHIIFLFLLIISVSGINFGITIDHYQRWCFSDFISEQTPYSCKVVGQAPNFQFSHVFKNGTILYKNPSNTDLHKRIDSYAAVSGEYQFCIENLQDLQTLYITYLEGIELSDVKNIPSQDDSKRIDQSIQKLNKIFQQVKQRQHYSMTINQYNMQLQKMVSFKSVGFGFLSIAVVLIISFLHYLQIKRVLHNRKVI